MTDGSPSGPADGRATAPPPTVSARKYKAVLVLCGLLAVALVAVTASLFTAVRLDDRTTPLAGGTSMPGSGPASEAPVTPSPEVTDEPSPTSTSTATEPPGVLIEPDPSAIPSVPDPEADFTEAYTGQRLRVTDDCSNRLIDLDEPRVGVERLGHEAQYTFCSGKSRFDFAFGTSISLGGTQGASAKDCVEAIRVGVDPNDFAPALGQHICVITSAETAREQGLSQKVVLLSVLGIAQDGTVTVEASAWNNPV